MEKRKWLWKRKPSERSPGETESSESVSSLSERYSDEQESMKTLPIDNTQSPEVTSKVTTGGDEMDDGVKILTEKLSAALVNVSAKEDLVKQHSKVAEEAVAGWEKAENEAALLKQQLDAVMQKNSALEDKTNHLDGALKECVRQLRQGREGQEQKIQEVILDKTREFESMKYDLETRLEFLERENSSLKENRIESSASVDLDLFHKLEFLERENKALKQELLSQSEELEIMTIERDLSAQAAENASKQHLDGIKKVAKLESECRRLQGLNRKLSLSNDQKSVSASSIYVESLTDSQSDSGERSTLISELDQIKSEKSLRASISGSPLELDIMDDFLEMERLVALPKSETKDKNVNSIDNQLKADFEAMTHKMVKLEEKVRTLEAEKSELEKVLVDSQSSCVEDQHKADIEAMVHRVVELEGKLRTVEAEKSELENVLVDIRSSCVQDQLKADVEAMIHRVIELEGKLRTVEAEKSELEKVLVDNRSSGVEDQLKADFETMSYRVFELESQLKSIEAEKIELKEAVAASRSAYEESQFQLKSIEAEKLELEEAVAASQRAYEESQFQLKSAEMKIEALQKELDEVNDSKEILEFRLNAIETEAQTLSSKVDLLNEEIVKEKNFSVEIVAKCRELEEKLAKSSQEIELQQAVVANGNVKIEQEEMDVAAGKLADCQKTIASLGRQLQSLATLEDFLIDTANLPGFSGDSEFWKLHSNGTLNSKNNSNHTKIPVDNSDSLLKGHDDEKSPPSMSSSTSLKSRNGRGKLFTRTKSGIQLENKQIS